MKSRRGPAPSGAVKKLKNGEFCSRNALKTKDRNFAKINFLTAPHGRGSERSGMLHLRLQAGRTDIGVAVGFLFCKFEGNQGRVGIVFVLDVCEDVAAFTYPRLYSIPPLAS
jgi:hypothetical protein